MGKGLSRLAAAGVSVLSVVATLVVPQHAASASVSTTSVSTAAACRNHDHQRRDGSFAQLLNSSAPVRPTGPYADCPIASVRFQTGDLLIAHCYVWNDVGNTWTWVSKDSSNLAGWVWDGNLFGNGSSVPCRE